MTSSCIPAARSQYLLELLAQVPDPRKRRGRRHPLAGLLAAGIAAVVAGSRSFAAIGQWAADADPVVLGGLGADRGPAEEPTFRRAFALVSADVLDQVLGAWLHTRASRAGGRLVIAVDGKAVRGARDAAGKAPHLVAALAHGIGAVLGQVAVTAKSNEIPAVRDLAVRVSAHRLSGYARAGSLASSGTPAGGVDVVTGLTTLCSVHLAAGRGGCTLPATLLYPGAYRGSPPGSRRRTPATPHW
jgi:DDE_Tnp_1-associated